MRALESFLVLRSALAKDGTVALASSGRDPRAKLAPCFLPIDRDGQSTVKPGGFRGLISVSYVNTT
jgi:hypothetical protein